MFLRISICTLLLCSSAQAESVCIGYLPNSKRWGQTGSSIDNAVHNFSGNCPRGYAFFSVNRQTGKKQSAGLIPVIGSCCKLPDDALSDSHVFEKAECPKDHVVTGAKSVPIDPSGIFCMERHKDKTKNCVNVWEQLDKIMRCTKINTKRYKLGDLQEKSISARLCVL